MTHLNVQIDAQIMSMQRFIDERRNPSIEQGVRT